jgi:DinB superfamily
MNEVCDSCGFTYDLGLARHAGDEIIRGTGLLAEIIDTGDRNLTQRPLPDTWSALEYGCHVRDVLLVQRERVLLALRAVRPSLVPMGRDERVEHDGYNEQSPLAVARQLRDAAALFAGVLGRLDEDGWSRTVIYNYPAPTERDLAWLAVHTHHEVHHHLGDVRAQIKQHRED